MAATAIRTPRGTCRFGCAQVDITPPPDAYHRNWGAALHDRAAGVHRPLVASVLTLAPASGGGPECVLVSLDLGWLRPREMAALLQALRQGTGASPEHLAVTFSHTHAATSHPGYDHRPQRHP